MDGLTSYHPWVERRALPRAGTTDRRGTIMTRGIFRKRWQQWLMGSFLTLGSAGLSGCVKPLYMTPETQHLVSTVGIPADLPTNPNVSAAPDVTGHKPPPTVLDANRDPRYMTLQEAISIALERGSRGNASAFLFQNFNQSQAGGRGGFSASFVDDLIQFTGHGITGDDAIRAFALDPAIAAADIEGALSKFDARFTASANWQTKDQAVANIFNNFNNGDFSALHAGLIKPLPTGGVVDITADMSYTKLSAVPAGFAVINPSYTPTLTVGFEQPLLRDSGIDINQLLAAHPGSTQLSDYRPSGGRSEGILVTRIRADQGKAQFESEVNSLVFNVELAYWSLYGRYYSKYANEQALRQAYVTWEQLQQLQTAGLQTKQGVAQARAQFEEFRLNYLVSLQDVLEAERRLRGILGLPMEDGQRVVPADTPILAPYRPEWNSSLVEALNNRPELRMARQELRVQQLNLMLAQNGTRPDLRVFANYSINSIGNRIDGPGPVQIVNSSNQIVDQPANAIASLWDNKFGSSTVGMLFNMPLGYRDAYASLKTAQLNLARSHIVLKNQERKTELFLGSLYQQLVAYHEQIKLQQARRIALGVQLQGQFERVKIGKDPLIQLLDAQRSFTQSIQEESDAISSYNIAIAGFHFAKGTILEYNNVSIGDGPLPAAVSERAADHFGARAAALKLRERPANASLPAEAGTAVSLQGLADGPPPKEAIDPDAPPTIDVPGGSGPKVPPATPPAPSKEPMPIPPSAPKDAKPIPPSIGKPTAAPETLPGLPVSKAAPDGPATPVSNDEPIFMPSQPVSKYRPK
jgi:outer membrane protein TolC